VTLQRAMTCGKAAVEVRAAAVIAHAFQAADLAVFDERLRSVGGSGRPGNCLQVVSGGRVARRDRTRVRRDADLLLRLAAMAGQVAPGDRTQAGGRAVGILVAASGDRSSGTLPARRASIRAVQTCPSLQGAPGNTAACNPTNGTCGQTPIAGCCTSDSDCTGFDVCVSGSCQPQTGCCQSNLFLVCATTTLETCQDAGGIGFPVTFVPGAVCNGATGTCGAADNGGDCCQTPLLPNNAFCYDGFALTVVDCANLGGTVYPGQSCTAQGCQ